MLVSIRIRNLALVEDLSLEFQKGFHAITGETGAGKSILIGALTLALGERADRDWIRAEADSCSVEAVFDISNSPSLPSLLESLGLDPCQEDQLFLKRIFNSVGANRQFVNGSPTTLQSLKKIGSELVDLHGPHDHQSLLHAEAQLLILDRYAGLEKARADYHAHWKRLRAIENEKRALIMDENEFQQQLELLEYQVREIDAARLAHDEEKKIETDYRLAANSQKVLDFVSRAQNALDEGETSAASSLTQAQRALQDLATIDPSISEFVTTNQQLLSQLQDLIHDLSRYADRVEIDPERLQFLSERVTLIQGLKRKYGKTLEEVMAFGRTAKERLEKLRDREASLIKLQSESASTAHALEKSGIVLRSSRKKIIPKLVQAIRGHLRDLGFAKSGFDAELIPCAPSSSGMDTLEFRFAPNVGEPAKPLREIASSGEMARVMLGIKTALADEDAVPVLVFDEVDANVGGEIGSRVGEKLERIGRRHQVLCITHLPQVAARAQHHFVVNKRIEKGRTLTLIEPLDQTQRVEEIARMLGGRGDTAIQHAKELLKDNKK